MTYDVIIVGAGPAGLSAALHAKQNGLHTLVLEKGALANAVVDFHRGKHVMDEPTVIPERMDLGLSYRFNFGRSKIGSNASDDGGLAQTPDITNSFHGFDILGRYRLTKHWMVQVNYLYEKYLEKDFTTDGITPSLANVAFDGFQTGSAADVRSVLLPLQHPNAAIHHVIARGHDEADSGRCTPQERRLYQLPRSDRCADDASAHDSALGMR